jgi:hypothetical protein
MPKNPAKQLDDLREQIVSLFDEGRVSPALWERFGVAAKKTDKTARDVLEYLIQEAKKTRPDTYRLPRVERHLHANEEAKLVAELARMCGVERQEGTRLSLSVADTEAVDLLLGIRPRPDTRLSLTADEEKLVACLMRK